MKTKRKASATGGNGRLARTKHTATKLRSKYQQRRVVKFRPVIVWRFELPDDEPTWRGYINGDSVAIVGRAGWGAYWGKVWADDACYDDWYGMSQWALALGADSVFPIEELVKEESHRQQYRRQFLQRAKKDIGRVTTVGEAKAK